MTAILLFVALCADAPVKGTASAEELRAYFELEEKTRENRESFYEREILRLKANFGNAKLADRPRINGEMEEVRRSLEKLRTDGIKGFVTEAPEVGTVAYIEAARIVSFPAKNVGLVWLGADRFSREKFILVSGLDSEKFSDGQLWKPETPFRAMRVDRGAFALISSAILSRHDRKPSGEALPTSFVVFESIDAEQIEKARPKYKLQKRGILVPKSKVK